MRIAAKVLGVVGRAEYGGLRRITEDYGVSERIKTAYVKALCDVVAVGIQRSESATFATRATSAISVSRAANATKTSEKTQSNASKSV